MPAVSIERIRDWLAAKRTSEDYAFTPIDIALGIGAPPAEVFLLCSHGADSGMLAAVTVGERRFFTHPSVGLEDKIGPKKLRALEELKKVRRAGDRYEWTPLVRAPAQVVASS